MVDCELRAVGVGGISRLDFTGFGKAQLTLGESGGEDLFDFWQFALLPSSGLEF
jgi:hypothetical protein